MNLKLNECFGSHMVLEQKTEVFIWGEATPNEDISILFQEKSFVDKTDEKGKFKFQIGPFSIDQGSDMVITCAKDKLILHDVAVGEVWLCAGQSNMEFPMGYDRELKKEENDLPQNIRYFDYPEVAYEGEINDANYHHFGFWRKATKHDLKYFTAVGYYFARRLSESMPDVPIGLLACNWGGTKVSCWMSKDALFRAHGQNIWKDFQDEIKGLDIPKYDKEFKKRPGNFRTTVFENQVVNWIMTGVSMPEIDKRLAKQGKKRDKWAPQPIGPYFEWRPCGLYHTMLLHVAPFTVKGVLWYQGESDADYATQYKDQLVEMIKEWRHIFQNKDLPFLIVQLAPFIHQFGDWGNNWPIIRSAQEWITEHVQNTGLAVITDSGMKWDIHPVYKRNVGIRLALQALNKVYDKDIPCEAPKMTKAFLNKEKQELVVYFSNCYEGLKLVADNDKRPEQREFVDGLALVKDGTIFDHLPVKKIKYDHIVLDLTGFNLNDSLVVNMAERDYYCVNLKNSADIPTRPGQIKVIEK